MKEIAQEYKESFEKELAQSKTAEDIKQLKVTYLGKKGKITSLMSELKNVPKEEKPLLGQVINELKQLCERLCEKRQNDLATEELVQAIEKEKIDITEPGRKREKGTIHPISQMIDEMLEITSGMGFTVQTGPDIERDWYNFGALNYPDDHPARDMQDTFYLNPEYLLRSHTSNTQVRVMEENRPPIRVVTPGTTYRNETISSRSHVFFHQIEGMYIDKDVTFADLISTMQEFLSKLFKTEVEMRFRPSYFPFVEPGVEVDIKCTACEGQGCALCKKTGWLEVVGAGMIHPTVLKNGNIDPEVYSGFAWGFGVERLALLRYGIPDIRLLFQNNAQFLEQF